MNKTLFRRTQFLSYIATIVIAVLLSLMVVKQYFFASEPSNKFSQRVISSSTTLPETRRPVPESPVGKTITLENINWKENKKTLVLYVSTTCRYCTESSSFYQRLVQENSARGVPIVAVMPQPIEEATAYLKANNVNIWQVYNSSLESIGVRATPTLLLVDENGVVVESWRGKLAENKEAEVISKLSS